MLEALLILDYLTCSQAHQLPRHQDEQQRLQEVRRERASELGNMQFG
jgi:hypothetical protein